MAELFQLPPTCRPGMMGAAAPALAVAALRILHLSMWSIGALPCRALCH
jgi:hypothetical protein